MVGILVVTMALRDEPIPSEPDLSIVEEFFLQLIIFGVLVNTVILLSHFGGKLARRYFTPRTTVTRIALEAAVLTVSSTIAFALLATFGNLSFSVQGEKGTSGTLLAIAISSIFSAVIGISVLIIKAAAQRRRERSSLLSQGDLLTAEFRAARSVQQSLLPDEDARLFGFDISGTTAPAVEIGGDYYDYITFADGTKGIIVADAAGKGIPAALVMAKFQGMAQALSIHIEKPEEFFVGLNDTLRIRLDRQNFITVGMLTIDFEDQISFFRAGHNPLFLYCSSSDRVETLKPQGMALGLTHGAMLGKSLVPCRFMMQPGDVALLYSDGLNEATNAADEEYGDERAAESLRVAARSGKSAAEIRAMLLNDLSNYVGDAEPHDDVTVVVVKKV
jgi:serine phosphatase RsbU (regulator of sigma subunit)